MFSWNARTFARPKQLIDSSPNNKYIVEHDFPCLADEIAETRPDMNIKITTFTESEKLYYTYIWNDETFYDYIYRNVFLLYTSITKINL